jgi:putative hydrolase of the HAD superfamily
MKFSKPNKQVFEYAYESALKHQKLSKKEIAHIGDNRFADYDGAINSGFNAILIQNKNEVEI